MKIVYYLVNGIRANGDSCKISYNGSFSLGSLTPYLWNHSLITIWTEVSLALLTDKRTHTHAHTRTHTRTHTHTHAHTRTHARTNACTFFIRESSALLLKKLRKFNTGFLELGKSTMSYRFKFKFHVSPSSLCFNSYIFPLLVFSSDFYFIFFTYHFFRSACSILHFLLVHMRNTSELENLLRKS